LKQQDLDEQSRPLTGIINRLELDKARFGNGYHLLYNNKISNNPHNLSSKFAESQSIVKKKKIPLFSLISISRFQVASILQWDFCNVSNFPPFFRFFLSFFLICGRLN